jgi:hypothetical protein
MARSGEGGVLAAKPKTARGALGFGLGCANPGAQYFVECVDGGVFLIKQWQVGLKVQAGWGHICLSNRKPDRVGAVSIWVAKRDEDGVQGMCGVRFTLLLMRL